VEYLLENHLRRECDMEEVIKFLKENRIGFLASVDNGKPRVRPWGFMFEEKGRFYFCTNTTKEVYKQLKNVPYVEFSCTNKESNTWLRLRGQITFSDDRKIKEKIIGSNELLKNMYKTADNPIFTIFYLEHGTASIWSFSMPTPKRFEF
jgi:uncharacterized pyridoxamine 5'-phosphate oxidase family protein